MESTTPINLILFLFCQELSDKQLWPWKFFLYKLRGNTADLENCWKFSVLNSGKNSISLPLQLKKYKTHSLNLNQSNFHWLNQKFVFSLIHQWKKYFSLLNQLISTEVMSEIWLIYSNLFLAIWISQISLIISRFWLIQI